MYPAFDLKSHIDPQLSNRDGTLSGTTANNGTGIDCSDYDGPIYATVLCGAATGSPTSYTLTAKLQESDDNSAFTDIANQDTVVLSADNTAKTLRGHRTKRYARVVVTPAFVGGSSPTVAGVFSVLQGQKRHTT